MNKRMAFLVCVFCAALALQACKPASSKRAITIVASSLAGKEPSPIFQNGDVLTWQDPQGHAITANFRIVTPCHEGKSVQTCTIDVPSGHGSFNYLCSPNICPDPEVPVGSDVVRAPFSATSTPPPFVGAPAYANPVDIYCDTTVTPNIAKADPPAQTASVGQAFSWEGVGDGPPVWTVTFASGQACSQGTSFSKDNPTCTPQTANTYTYTIHVNNCGTTDGSATLTIQ